jgi:hypothetical protein
VPQIDFPAVQHHRVFQIAIVYGENLQWLALAVVALRWLADWQGMGMIA